MTRITATAEIIISFFNEGAVEAGRPGGTAAQNKSDYPGTVFFLFQLQHLSLPFVEYFPDLLQTFHTLAFRVSVSAPNPYLFVHFFALFCTYCQRI